MPEADAKKIQDIGGGTELPQAISYVVIGIAIIIFLLSVWIRMG